MNTAAAMAGAVVALLGTAAGLVVSDLLSQEIRARLLHLPFLILRLAARQLPAELRTEIHEETWLPEVHHILGDEATGPLTRLTEATRLALSLWLRGGGRQMAEALTAVTPPSLAGFEDIRALSPARRRAFGELTARLHDMLRHPAGALDRDVAARLLTATADACEAYIDDRDETTARSLAEAARPLAGSLHPDHPAGLGIRRAHAHALLQLGDSRRAEALLRELAADEARILGPGTPGTFPTRRLLGWALLREGRPREAEAEFRSLAARVPPSAAPLRLHIHCMLSWTLFRQGRRPEAENGYHSVIASRLRRLGPRHPDTLDARHSMGKMLVLSGEGERAREVLRPLLADRRRVLGARHPDTLETRKYLAVARALMPSRTGGIARRRALRTLRRIARAQTGSQGPGHPRTRDTRRWLGTLGGEPAARDTGVRPAPGPGV
ncbi:tetratricopeptide repeat protein [Streptomyces sp. CAU 1734]|uniref:tetratricopeptide repeat protein n=1 Tax=Streptomyces sp. CAU 1734 TaxID=3140360 RepID=UPI003260A5BF